MAEYIEREEAIKSAVGAMHGVSQIVAVDVVEALEGVQAADVVAVRHGEWVYHECVSSHDGAKSGFACSVCSGFVEEDIFDMDEFNKDFCGACGAKLDGKGEGANG